ncbi:MAG: hypothetical protein KGH71_02760 [Candidatus Micrarchaeota archaeon]|nr:hypothetical protein [Candidatus Micrarchaeota archaeon]
MPTINIEFDDKKVSDSEIVVLSNEIRRIIHKLTKIDDVFVYANSSRIIVKAAPIEVYVRITASKIRNVEKLLKEIKEELGDWKKKSGFKHKINLTLWPVEWKFEIGI